MGRSADDEIVALSMPSPGTTNGVAAINPSVTYVRDGTSLTFTVVAEPGFQYVAEVSGDLLEWQPFGGSVLATGGSVQFTDTVGPGRRFYRFRRNP